ncbi:tumor protein D54-like isoform X4 [Ostrea edulis]|uniref:tumor protein D54-like isoform X4 n=1 Tax=Ostrea edulis TaxID=37623 RepID=UPI0024AFABBC|nr:tumor protein D54-like isoform X4 [Ostrea edulis]
MFSFMAKKSQPKSDKNDKEPQATENGEADEDFKLKISESSNYHKFLQLTLEGSQSDDEGSHGDLDGYIEDDIVGETFLSECDADIDASDLTEADEHLFEKEENATPAAEEPMSEEDRQRQIEEWKEELSRVEGEISTLRQVLGSKVRYASELKRKIGITPFQELKHDFSEGIKSIQQSDTYQKTNEKLTNLQNKITGSTAYQKTSSAVKTASEKTNETVRNVATSVSKKLGDFRNSGAFKSVEEKVGGAYANVKTSRSIENFKERLKFAKVTGSKSEDNFESALQQETEGTTAANGDQPTSLPEEKIPL